MKPLLLGEAPSEAGDRYWRFPLSGAPAVRICKLMAEASPLTGWEVLPGEAAYWTLVEHFDTMNAIERYRDAYPWNAPRARQRWQAWRAENPGDLVVVALGRKAADAVGVRSPEWGEWDGGPDGFGYLERVAAPHTSGRSRIMNQPEMRDLLVRVLREASEKAEEA